MNKKEKVYFADKVVTVFGHETSFIGNLSFKTSVKICGDFKGSIKTEGYLEIAPEAKVEAEIEADNYREAKHKALNDDSIQWEDSYDEVLQDIEIEEVDE